GKNGEKLLEYVKWLKNRVETMRTCDCYKPIFHIDVYGTIGDFTNNDVPKMTAYLKTLEEAAAPFKLRIEGPMDMGEREKQMQVLAALTKSLDENNVKVELVADEWCNTLEDIQYFADNRAGHMIQIKTPDLGGINNTIEAILYCKEKGIGAY
ncbi:enolase C-terminal domain-like protein, partial [Treponema pedis]